MLSLLRRRRGSASGVSDVQHGLPSPESSHAQEDRVGPYRLCVELASGGMATVYLARRETEHGLGHAVAVKLIHPHLANDRDFIEMFMDEAELASRIRHPNVCAVLDYDLREESYLVMEYLVGESMMAVAKAIDRSDDCDLYRRAACVARMLADACEGLHAAHELTDAEGKPLHVVHRDVSLENVFVTYDGVAKVMDFGVATAANKRHQTRTGMVKGKFASVAPECLKGHKPDRRADIWGIGVIAWELLTGRRLFRRDTDIDTLCAVADAVIQRPSECRPGLPSAIDEIVMRALARDPDQRYATARELGRDLARFSAGEVLTCADVAEWLDELFPGGRQRRQQIVELASHAGGRGEHDSAAHWRVPSQPPPAPAPFLQEPTLATKLWLGARPGSPPPPPRSNSSPFVGVPVPTSPKRRPWRWRMGLVVTASATAGALATLLAQALLQGSGWSPSLVRTWTVRAPGPSAESVAPAGAAVAEPPREIVLRIRIDPTSLEQTPTMVIDEDEVHAATLEAAAVPLAAAEHAPQPAGLSGP